LCFALVEIYVKTYGEANFVGANSSETRRRVSLHSPEAMAHHPTGIAVDIGGIEASNRVRCCEEHAICGSVLVKDAVVRIRNVQIHVDGVEELALPDYWISDGIN
jgi:hypothetical protein